MEFFLINDFNIKRNKIFHLSKKFSFILEGKESKQNVKLSTHTTLDSNVCVWVDRASLTWVLLIFLRSSWRGKKLCFQYCHLLHIQSSSRHFMWYLFNASLFAQTQHSHTHKVCEKFSTLLLRTHCSQNKKKYSFSSQWELEGKKISLQIASFLNGKIFPSIFPPCECVCARELRVYPRHNIVKISFLFWKTRAYSQNVIFMLLKFSYAQNRFSTLLNFAPK